MSDFISREDALNVISQFQFETYGKNDKELTKENQNRWFKAHGMQKLFDGIYQIPCCPKEPEARQIVKQVKWLGEVHMCNKCKKNSSLHRLVSAILFWVRSEIQKLHKMGCKGESERRRKA